MNWNDLRLRIRALFFRRSIERELDDELQFHLVMQSRKHAATGMSEREALRRALLDFGGLDKAREECRAARGTELIETLLHDVRYAVRGFLRAPGFALAVVMTIALGLGVNTTLFTILNAYVLRPLAVRDPYSLYRVFWRSQAGKMRDLAWPEFQSLRSQNATFAELIGYRPLMARVEGHPLIGELVTGNYFRTLSVNASQGRILAPADDSAPGSEPVVVLSYTAWQKKFGGAPDILGRKLFIRGYPMEVVGIASAGFMGLTDTPDDFWVPLSMAGQLESGPSLFGPERPERLRVIGRLKPQWSVRQAESALASWASQATENLPDTARLSGSELQSQATAVRVTPQFWLNFTPIAVAFAFVLLIACANVANLMLARALSRQREIGIRLSLGAARSRLIRQLLTESIVLAVPAAVAGFGVSEATIRLGERLIFATMPRDFVEFVTIIPLAPDLRVFAFMLAAALISALLFGLVPAIQATRASVAMAAKGDFSSEYRPARLRSALVVLQVTTCVLLLISASSLLHSASRMESTDVGFRTRGIVVLEIQDRFRLAILARLRTEPVVQTVASAQFTPLNGATGAIPVIVGQDQRATEAFYNLVSPEFFGVLDVPILRGRNFTQDEAAAGAPVAIVSQATARKLWPNHDALGQSIHIPPGPRRGRDSVAQRHAEVRVIGVSADIVTCCMVLGKDVTRIYLPATPATSGASLLTRVHGDEEHARRRIDRALASVNPGAIDQIHPMQQFRAGAIYPFQAAAWVCSILGSLALLLTLSGIYGVLAYLVTQRIKEIGIRVSLGATRAAIIGLVLKQSMYLTFAGIACGAILAFAASSALASRIVFIRAFDGPAWLAAVLVALAASAGGTILPSCRAACVDPANTLRHD